MTSRAGECIFSILLRVGIVCSVYSYIYKWVDDLWLLWSQINVLIFFSLLCFFQNSCHLDFF